MGVPLHVVSAGEVARQERESSAVQAARIRKDGHAEAIALLVDGRPGRAYAVVMRTFIQQVRVLGWGYAGIPGRPYSEGGDLSW